MIRVLVVDDSAVVRTLLAKMLAREPDLAVVGAAVDAYDAREQIVRLCPDVVTLDIEMPRMDGLSFLARLMKFRPLPVVVVSSLARDHGDAAVRALELGATEVIAKPSSPLGIERVAAQLATAVRTAAMADIRGARSSVQPVPPRRLPGPRISRNAVIAIGASTGGPVALQQLLAGLPPGAPGVLIVQHITTGFTGALARRLDESCAMAVHEARNGDAVRPGVALIAPGDSHLVLLSVDGQLRTAVRSGPPVNYQRPSIDVLFHSVAQVAGASAVGVLLTGMGKDGASGMRALRQAGGHTIAQDEQTCAVFSMPSEAIRFDGACEVLPLPRIATAALRATLRQRAAGHA
jgi:two-component system, chemotaxis family, protein-glutamate methylesterase/glutaminase